MKSILRLSPLLAALWLAGCGTGRVSLPATISVPTFTATYTRGVPAILLLPPSSTPRTIPTQTPTPRPTVTPIASSSPTMGPLIIRTPAPPAECPPPGNPAPIRQTDDPEVLAKEIERFLDDGGSPTALRASVVRAVGALGDVYSIVHPFVEAVDATGDTTADIIVSLGRLYGNEDYGGGVLVWTCKEGAYHPIFTEAVQNQMTMSEVVYVATADLNANGTPELVYVILEENVGAAGTLSYVVVMEWDGTGFQDLVSPPEEANQFYPSPAAILWDLDQIGSVRISKLQEEGYDCDPDSLFSDVDGDGRLEFVLEGPAGGYQWPFGVGEEYDHFDTWGWNGQSFTLRRVTVLPSFDRMEAVVEGDKAFAEGEFERAVEFYRYEFGYGYSAEEYGHPFYEEPPPDLPPSHPLTAYGQFRGMVAYAGLSSLGDMDKIRSRMAEDFPPGTSDFAYVEMAELFYKEYVRTNDLSAACLEAQTFASQHEEDILGPLREGRYGDRLFSGYTPVSICPVR